METLSSYDRFFAFGCSFTDYRWPTWADIIGHKFNNKFYNFGSSGSDNSMIMRSVADAHVNYKFKKDDLVIIMWTDVLRESIYHTRQFVGTGNILGTRPVNSKEELDNMLHAYYVKDILNIFLTIQFLDSLSIDYYMLSTVPLNKEEHGNLIKIDSNYLDLSNLINSKIIANMFELVYRGKWESHDAVKLIQGDDIIYDRHPSPSVHYLFLKKVFPELKLSSAAIEYTKYYNNLVSSGIDVTLKGHIHDKYPYKNLK